MRATPRRVFVEPQNIEQGISNDEVKNRIPNSIVIRISNDEGSGW
jgi:hypothetical protein